MNYSKWEIFSEGDDDNDEINHEALYSQLLSRKLAADALFQQAENDKTSSSVAKYQLAVDSYKDVVHFGYKYSKQGVVSEKWNRLLYSSKLNVATCLLRCNDFANCVKVCEEAVVMIQQAPYDTIDYQSFLRGKYFLAYAHIKLKQNNYISTVLPIVAEMKSILSLEGKFELLPSHRQQYEDLFAEVQRLVDAKRNAKNNTIDISGRNHSIQQQEHVTVDPVDLLKIASATSDYPQMLKVLRGEKSSIVQSLGRGRYLWLMAELAALSIDVESARRLLDESMQHLANESISSFSQVTSIARALLLRQRAHLECHPSLSVSDLTLAVTYYAQSLLLLEDGVKQGLQVLNAPSADSILQSCKPSQSHSKDELQQQQQPQQRMVQLMQFIISPTPPTLLDLFDYYHTNIDLILDELRNTRQFHVALVFAKHAVKAYHSIAFHMQEVIRMSAVKLPFTAEAKQKIITVLHAISQALLRRRAIAAFKFSQLLKLSDHEANKEGSKKEEQQEITDHDHFELPPLILDEEEVSKPDALSDLFVTLEDTSQSKNNSGLPAQIAFQAAKQLFQLKDHHSALSIARSTGGELLASHGIAAFTAMQQTTTLAAEQAEMFHDTWRLVAQSTMLDLNIVDKESALRLRQEIIIALFNAALCAMSGNLMHLAQRALESAEESRRDLETQHLTTDKDKAEFKALFGDLSIHLGQVYLRVGRYKDAEEATKDSITYYGTDHEDDEILRSRAKQATGQLAMIYAAWGKPRQAEQALQAMKQTAMGPIEDAEEETSQMRRMIDERQPVQAPPVPVVATSSLRNRSNNNNSRDGTVDTTAPPQSPPPPVIRSRTTWQKVGRLFDHWLKKLVESDLADFNMLASYLILLSVVLAIVCVAIRLTQDSEEEEF